MILERITVWKRSLAMLLAVLFTLSLVDVGTLSALAAEAVFEEEEESGQEEVGTADLELEELRITGNDTTDEDIVITVRATGADSVVLGYRQADMFDYTALEMTALSAGTYEAVLDRSEIWTDELEWYITVTAGDESVDGETQISPVLSPVGEEASPLLITEAVITSTKGTRYSYFELYNNSDTTLNLSDYTIWYLYPGGSWLEWSFCGQNNPEGTGHVCSEETCGEAVTLAPAETLIVWPGGNEGNTLTLDVFNAFYGTGFTQGVDLVQVAHGGFHSTAERTVKIGKSIETSFVTITTNGDGVVDNPGVDKISNQYTYRLDGFAGTKVTNEAAATPGTVESWQIPDVPVVVEAPELNLDSINYQQEYRQGEPITISAEITGTPAFIFAALYYREGSGDYQKVDLERYGTTYAATLDRSGIMADEIEWYIELSDGYTGAVTTSQVYTSGIERATARVELSITGHDDPAADIVITADTGGLYPGEAVTLRYRQADMLGEFARAEMTETESGVFRISLARTDIWTDALEWYVEVGSGDDMAATDRETTAIASPVGEDASPILATEAVVSSDSGARYTYFELYNNSDRAFDLSDYTIWYMYPNGTWLEWHFCGQNNPQGTGHVCGEDTCGVSITLDPGETLIVWPGGIDGNALSLRTFNTYYGTDFVDGVDIVQINHGGFHSTAHRTVKIGKSIETAFITIETNEEEVDNPGVKGRANQYTYRISGTAGTKVTNAGTATPGTVESWQLPDSPMTTRALAFSEDGIDYQEVYGEDDPVTISARITGSPAFVFPALYYRQGTGSYERLTMERTGEDVYSATVDRTGITADAIEWYIQVEDGLTGDTYTSAAYTSQVARAYANVEVSISGNDDLTADIVFTADTGGGYPGAEINLRYRQAELFDEYETLAMTETASGVFQAALGHDEVWTDTLEWFVEVVDGETTDTSRYTWSPVVCSTDTRLMSPLLATEATVTSASGARYSYFELYNNSDATIDLSQYTIWYNYPNGTWLEWHFCGLNNPQGTGHVCGPDTCGTTVTLDPGKTLIVWPGGIDGNALPLATFNSFYGTDFVDGVDIVQVNHGGFHSTAERTVTIGKSQDNPLLTFVTNRDGVIDNPGTSYLSNQYTYRLDTGADALLVSNTAASNPGQVYSWQLPDDIVSVAGQSLTPVLGDIDYQQYYGADDPITISIEVEGVMGLFHSRLYYNQNNTGYKEVDMVPYADDSGTGYTVTLDRSVLWSDSISMYIKVTDGSEAGTSASGVFTATVDLGEDGGDMPVLEALDVPTEIDEGQELFATFFIGSGVQEMGMWYRFDGQGEFINDYATSSRVSYKYFARIPAPDIFGHDSIEFFVYSYNGVRTAVSETYTVTINRANDTEGAVRLSVADGNLLSGTRTISANDGGDNRDTEISIDGTPVTDAQRVLENGAWLCLDSTGLDSYFKNAVTAPYGDDERELLGFVGKATTLARKAIFVDDKYFSYDEYGNYTVTLTVWAGTSGTPFEDMFIPDENRDDFNIFDVYLVLANGEEIDVYNAYQSWDYGTGSYYMNETMPGRSTIYKMGDTQNGTMAPTLELTFRITEDQLTGIGYALDTTALSDGEHTITGTSGDMTTTATVTVDNTPPEIDLGITEGQTLTGTVVIDPVITDENGVDLDMVTATLDGEEIELPYTLATRKLAAGDHTLAVAACDGAGNYTVETVTFTTDTRDPADITASQTDITDASATLEVQIGEMNADSGVVDFALGRSLTLENGEITVLEGVGDEIAPVADTSGDITTTAENGDLPYQIFTLSVGETGPEDTVWVNWTGGADYADDNRTIKLYALNTSYHRWDQIGETTGSELAVDFAAGQYVRDGEATLLVQSISTGSPVTVTTSPEANAEALSPYTGYGEYEWDGEGIPESYDFAFVWMTDTQYYAESWPWHYYNQNQWIIDNAEELNIPYVIHTGDIVDETDQIDQWEMADDAMTMFEQAGIPYGVLAGNHDVEHGLEEYDNYWAYFGEDRFADSSVYGGSYRNNLGHYDLLTLGGQDLIILYMSWDIYEDEVEWMNQVLAEYSDRLAIIAVHRYARVSLSNDQLLDYAGKTIRDNVVAQNPNVIATINGHYHGASIQVDSFDDNGDGIMDRDVYQICVDYQSGPEGGEEYMQLLYFDLENGKIYMNAYSPYMEDFNYFDKAKLDTYGSGTMETGIDIFELDVDFDTDPKSLTTESITGAVYTEDVIGRVADVEDAATFSLTGLEANETYSWYAGVTNADGGFARSAVSTFTTGESTEPERTSTENLGFAQVTEGDTTVGGTAIAGAAVEIQFPGGAAITATASSSGNWTVSVPAGMTLSAGDELSATQTETGKLASDAVTTRVQAGPAEPEPETTTTDELSFRPVTEGDSVVSGSALALAFVEVRFADGTSVAATAGSGGHWTVSVPAEITLSEGDVLRVTQTETGKLASDAVTTNVQGRARTETGGLGFRTVTEGDGVVSGTALTRAVVEVQFPDGTSAVAMAGSGGFWTVSVPSGTELAAGDALSATQTESGKLPSEAVTTRVAERAAEPDPGTDPELEQTTTDYLGFAGVTAGDTTVAGTGLAGAAVTVSFPGGARVEATADNSGRWIVFVPAGLTLSEGDALSATQTETGKLPSGAVTALVAGEPVLSQDDHTVTFSLYGGREATAEVPHGEAVAEPGEPERLGYTFDGWYADRALTEAYDFTAPVTGDITLFAGWVQNIRYGFYGDVTDESAWYYEDVYRGSYYGLFEGTGNGFEPENSLTRAHLVNLLYSLSEMLDLDTSVRSNETFADVESGDWYADIVAWAVAAELTDGYGNGDFGPNDPVTRQQVAVFMVRFSEYADIELETLQASGTVSAYSDREEISSWAYSAVDTATRAGLLNGHADGSFGPEDSTKRAQAAALFVRYFEQYVME